jgi:hypothetical protein
MDTIIACAGVLELLAIVLQLHCLSAQIKRAGDRIGDELREYRRMKGEQYHQFLERENARLQDERDRRRASKPIMDDKNLAQASRELLDKLGRP